MATTLKLTDTEVQALFFAMAMAESSFAGMDDEDMTTATKNRFKALERIEAKLEEQGWN